MTGPAGSWAREAFGDHARDLAAAVGKSLNRAHERARSGQDGVHTQTFEAYGHGLYAAQFEELEDGLRDFEHAGPVRLHARTVMLVAGHLIYPFRYADRDLPVTAARLKKAEGLRADLIRMFGPEDPLQGELDLGLAEFTPEPHRGLARIPAGTSLVLVACACSMSEGVLRSEWGRADLGPDRYLQWHCHEPL